MYSPCSDSLGFSENKNKNDNNIYKVLHISKSLQIKCLTIILWWKHYNNNDNSFPFSKMNRLQLEIHLTFLKPQMGWEPNQGLPFLEVTIFMPLGSCRNSFLSNILSTPIQQDLTKRLGQKSRDGLNQGYLAESCFLTHKTEVRPDDLWVPLSPDTFLFPQRS